jgi:1-deoxy-D-xylulose-5-phosphate synthase
MDKRILDRIDSPKDLKALSWREMKQLAAEIREELVRTVSTTGGHLAPNLGVVELTLGLHYALDSPRDKIVWDVGHQSYTHKLITGRREQFNTLRQYGGISGFPKREESEHDIADTGHASTSISIALGLAEARDREVGDWTVVAVIGDGSLTGGMAYEGLNQAGHHKTKLIVILNDNVMSIATNVGAMSSYLNRMRLDPTYNKLRNEIEQRIKRIPAIGETMLTIGEHLRDGLKQLLVPGMLFEELGFRYIGPIDGHNIEEIARTVQHAKQLDGPIIIHVLTKKGYGYEPAEKRPDEFHGTSPFVIETGKPKSVGTIPSYTEVFGRTLTELAARNKKIIAVTAAMPSGTGLDIFEKSFPDRFYDVGIAEQHAVTFSVGLALAGFVPVVAIYSTFLQRAYDQVVHDVCLQNIHVVFALDRAGVVGEDGPTHHGAFDLSYLRHMPNMSVMAPKDEEEFRHMLHTAVEGTGPIAIRYPRGSGTGVPMTCDFHLIEPGKAEVLKRGEDVCIFAVGRMVSVADKAASQLEKQGITTTLVNARFIKPLDERLVCELASQHRLLVTVEENSVVGGFGSAILEALARFGLTLPTVLLGIPDRFVEHGSPNELLTSVGLTPESLAKEIRAKLKALGSGKQGGLKRIAQNWLKSGSGIARSWW